MKATIVPAQITTVEDKIAGSLSLSQLLLLVAPVFIDSAVYVIFPPNFAMAAYKIALMSVIALVFALLAIRIKGRILLLWAVVMLRYAVRPRHYVFNKNDTYLRDIAKSEPEEEAPGEETAEVKKEFYEPLPNLTLADAARLQQIMSDPKANLHFKTDKKGALYVYITEVK